MIKKKSYGGKINDLLDTDIIETNTSSKEASDDNETVASELTVGSDFNMDFEMNDVNEFGPYSFLGDHLNKYLEGGISENDQVILFDNENIAKMLDNFYNNNVALTNKIIEDALKGDTDVTELLREIKFTDTSIIKYGAFVERYNFIYGGKLH